MNQHWSRRFVLAAGASGVFAAPVIAQERILSAPEVAQKVTDGEMVLLDIRSRGEWKDSGLAEGALPVSMHERDFGAKLQAILAQHPPEQVALICATGGRSAHVISILEQNGISGVWDVSEGMMGNDRGPGWIARQMSVVSLDAAEEKLRSSGAISVD